MQLFKLFALAPLGVSLVAAAAIPSSITPYGSLITRDAKPVDSKINVLRNDRNSIPTVKAALDVDAGLDVYANVVNHTYQAIADLDVKFQVDVKQNDGSFLRVLIDLEEIFSVTIDAHEKIINATVDSASSITVDSLDKGTVEKYAEVFASVQSMFEVWLDSGNNFHAEFSVKIDAFIQVLVRYLHVTDKFATGITTQIQAQLEAFATVADKVKGKVQDPSKPPPAGSTIAKLMQ